MQKWRTLDQRTRLLLAGGVGVGAALLVCVFAGAAYTTFLSQAALEVAPSGDGGASTSEQSPTSGALAAAASSSSSPTPSATTSPTASPTTPVPPTTTRTPLPPAATKTSVPPTATNTPTPPDLVCEDLEDTVDADGYHDLTLTYSNQGGSPVAAGYTYTMTIDGPVFDVAEDFSGESLDPGEHFLRTWEDQTPSQGTWVLTVIVDSGGDVTETDEGNNQCSVTFVVNPPVTLVPATLSP